MKEPPPKPLDLRRLRPRPLAERRSLLNLKEILVEPSAPPPEVSPEQARLIDECAETIWSARRRGAAALLIYGAHLIKNGGQLLLQRLIDHGWITHLATNGAGTIHDWEFAFHGKTAESVRENVAQGAFGLWEETGRNINLALLLGGIRGEGYGRALGRFIQQDGGVLPDPAELERQIREDPAHPLAPARAELLAAMRAHNLRPGPLMALHHYRNASVLARAFHCGVPITVHPGIGYDIITNHPMFCGAAIGRAAAADFRLLAGALERLDGGVALNIGTAIMGPQVFEKALSCVNHLRLQEGRPIVHDHHIWVVDIQDAGGWDWSRGEPPPDNPAYYLRFCKSYSRMGGRMRYVQCDNIRFLHRLYHKLCSLAGRPARNPGSPETAS